MTRTPHGTSHAEREGESYDISGAPRPVLLRRGAPGQSPDTWDEAMKAIDPTWTVFLDPDYSILGLASSGRNGVQYLDVVTGWQGPRRVWPAVEALPRRDRLK